MFEFRFMFTMFLSLALGYGICVVANKQTGVLRTLGYTLGIAILVISLLLGVAATEMGSCMKGMKGMGGMKGGMACCSHHMMK